MEKYICSVCGSDDILVHAWVNPKNNKVVEKDEEECYCNKCKEIVEYETIEKIERA